MVDTHALYHLGAVVIEGWHPRSLSFGWGRSWSRVVGIHTLYHLGGGGHSEEW